MYTIYNGFTGQHVLSLEDKAQVERICSQSETLIFDDTCSVHETAYQLCKEKHP